MRVLLGLTLAAGIGEGVDLAHQATKGSTVPDVDAPSFPEDGTLVSVPIPALVAVLVALERRKGSELTEDEVLAARDKAVRMQMPLSVAQRMEQARGYADINPEDVWTEWQRFRHARES